MRGQVGWRLSEAWCGVDQSARSPYKYIIYILLETKNKYQVCIYILTLSSTYILTDVCKHVYHTFVVMNDY